MSLESIFAQAIKPGKEPWPNCVRPEDAIGWDKIGPTIPDGRIRSADFL